MRIMLLALLVASLTSGCESYDVKINEKLVYSPGTLFRDFEISDEALRTCVSQRILDERISDPLDLTQLNCSNGAIESLSGLAAFSAIKELKLSENRIRNLVELTQIPTLEKVWLDANNVVDPVPLYELPNLQLLDLSLNPSLQCPKSDLLGQVASVTLPKHCRTS